MKVIMFFSVFRSGDCHLGMTLLYVRLEGDVDLHCPPPPFLTFEHDARMFLAKGKVYHVWDGCRCVDSSVSTFICALRVFLIKRISYIISIMPTFPPEFRMPILGQMLPRMVPLFPRNPSMLSYASSPFLPSGVVYLCKVSTERGKKKVGW
jgi:hypothetical protein